MIRKGNFEDLQKIMGIIYDATADMDSKGIFQWDSIYPDDEVIKEDLSCGELYVYDDEGKIKGFIVLNEYQDEEYKGVKWNINYGKQLVVHRLCIDPAYQGQGIARTLMKYAEQYGKEHEYGSIRLDAFVNNLRACRLYEKLGYKAVGVVEFRKGKFYCFEKGLVRQE